MEAHPKNNMIALGGHKPGDTVSFLSVWSYSTSSATDAMTELYSYEIRRSHFPGIALKASEEVNGVNALRFSETQNQLFFVLNWNNSGTDDAIFFGRVALGTGKLVALILEDIKIDWSAPVLIARYSNVHYVEFLWKNRSDEYEWLSTETLFGLAGDNKLFKVKFNQDIDFFADLSLAFDDVNTGYGSRSANYMYAVGRQQDGAMKFMGIDSLNTNSQCLLTFSGMFSSDPDDYYVLAGKSDDVVIVA